jgi:hypothetical protein
MAVQPSTDERQVDADGVVRIRKKSSGPGRWLVGAALGFTLVCGALSLWLRQPPAPVAVAGPVAPVRRPAPLPAPTAPARPAPLAATPAPEAPPPAPVAQAEDEGPKEGLKLYRPGTKPLKQGLIVPDGFELPPGYVRHYQATDDGQRVRPILMFHPDYQPKDAQGRPVELPASRVVPPEFAPPGMPLDVLEPPEGPEGVEPLP